MFVDIGGKRIGYGYPCYVIAEVGINHNGDVELAKSLVSLAADAGVDAIKFQKRTIDVVYTAEELAKPRTSPFGETNGDLKRALELSVSDYTKIDLRCRAVGIPWFASCWDEQAVDDIEPFNPPCYKIASASLVDRDLVIHTCSKNRPIILSTGMCDYRELDWVVREIKIHGNPLILMHTVSTYPAKEADLNLRMIQTLRDRYELPVGYSGHEVGLSTTVAAVAMGACCVERHITLDRSMFGSDQSASVEPEGLRRLVRYIRTVESALGDGVKRVLDDEVPIQQKLRRRVTV